ncbi:MFS transporter [Leptospira santarosai]|uniref:MFS transporter n=1 Tax=Leptospira santarosai TaxID=28183 RepID=UPI0002BD89A2|nr:MFS transporter [Leptospira santarosai]EMO73597.1 transporter, major facilitator family protein [Leptospira santarosai str. 200403458]EMO98245.1 transporter, major facilitator family protein [Leptospira santarosai str. 200702252]
MVIFFLISAFFSYFAGNIFNYSIILLSSNLSKGEVFSGLTYMITYIPVFILSNFVGKHIHIRSNRFLLFTFHFIFALSGLLILTFLSKLNFFLLITSVIINGLCFAYIIPCRFNYLNRTVGKKQAAKYSIVLNILLILTFSISPKFTGWILEKYSYNSIMIVIIAFFLLSNLFLFLFQIKEKNEIAEESAQIVENINPELKRQVLTFTAVSYFLLGPAMILIPGFCNKILNLSEYQRGDFLSFLGFGLLIGGILATLFFKFIKEIHIYFYMLMLMGLVFSLIPVANSLLTMKIFLMLTGIFGGILGGFISGMIQLILKSKEKGSFLAQYSRIIQVSPPFFGFLAGLVSSQIGISMTMTLCGLVIFILSVIMFFKFSILIRYNLKLSG